MMFFRRIAAAVLIGIVVLDTTVCVSPAHAISFVHPAVVRIMGMAKRIIVTDVPVCNEDGKTVSHGVNVGSREHIGIVNTFWQCRRREHSNQPVDIWFTAPLRRVFSYCEGGFEDVHEYGRKSDIVCRRNSIIFPRECNFRLPGLSKALYISGNNSNVRTELSSLIVSHSSQLLLTGYNLPLTLSNLLLTGSDLVMTQTHLSPTSLELAQRGDQQSEREESVQKKADSNSYFGSKSSGISIGIVFVICIVSFLQGYKRFIYRGQLFGVAMVVGATVSGMIAMWLLIGWSSGHLWFPSDYGANWSTFSSSPFHCLWSSLDERIFKL
jgi:hypothetical protein